MENDRKKSSRGYQMMLLARESTDKNYHEREKKVESAEPLHFWRERKHTNWFCNKPLSPVRIETETVGEISTEMNRIVRQEPSEQIVSSPSEPYSDTSSYKPSCLEISSSVCETPPDFDIYIHLHLKSISMKFKKCLHNATQMNSIYRLLPK